MSKKCICEIKEKCEKGVNSVKNAIDTAKSVSIHPKLDASLCIKSDKNNKSFDNSIKFDKTVTLWDIISILLGVVAAFVAAKLIVNAIFSKKCKNKKAKEAPSGNED